MAAAALGSFSAFQTSAGYFLVSLGRIPECAAFVSDLLQFYGSSRNGERHGKISADFDAITANQVCFSYPGAKAAALRSVTFSVRKNQTVAIVRRERKRKNHAGKAASGDLSACGRGKSVMEASSWSKQTGKIFMETCPSCFRILCGMS